MRRSKFISVMTSLAMTGTMVMSAMPLTVNAAASNPLGLAITADQTTFTAADAGKKVTVYVDAVGSVADSDHVGSVEFKLKSDSWGTLDPTNLIITNENAIGTDKGNVVKSNKPFNELGTMVISKWDEGSEKPKKAGYAIQDYANIADFKGYTDEYCPAVLIMSDSSKGFIKTDASYGKHIAEFQITVPSKEGKYTLSLDDAKSMICVDGSFGSNASENIASPTAKSLTFTVGSASDPGTDPGTDTPPIEVKPGDPDPIASQRVYDGSATLTIGDGKAAVGEEIEVPVYLELGSDVKEKYITGIAFKTKYDTSALELTEVYEPEESALSDGALNASVDTGNILYTFTVADITVDSKYPMCILKFKVKDAAKDGDYNINVVNHLYSESDPIQIIHLQSMDKTTYLTPTIKQGTITVGAGSSDEHLIGDANQDGKVNVRDCATIASALAKGTVDSLKCSICADYNKDGKVNVRDAAAIASALAKGTIKTN